MTGREKIQRHVISEILLQLQHAAIKDIRPYSIGSTTAIGPINKHDSGDQAPAVSCSKDTVQGNCEYGCFYLHIHACLCYRIRFRCDTAFFSIR